MTALKGLLIAALVALSVGRSADATESPSGGAYDDCHAMCVANYDTICEPAVVAASNGKIPQENVAPMCDCGILICSNVCTREMGAGGEVRALPQECIDLGVTEE